MTTRTYAALLEHAREIVASGRWAILDAVFARRAERAAVVRLARELGVPSGILYCEAPRAELARRLDRRAAEGRDVSDATSALLPSQMEHLEPLLDDERPRFADVASHAGLGAWLAALRART